MGKHRRKPRAIARRRAPTITAPWRRYVPSALFFTLLAWTAALLLPAKYSGLSLGLDGSWNYALNYFAHSSYKFGPDLIFTHGPLGFVGGAQHIGWNLPTSLTIQSAVWIVLFWQILAMYRSGRRAAAFLLLLGLFITHQMYFDVWDYLASALVLTLLARLMQIPQRTPELALLAALAGLLFLVKFTAFLLTALLLAIYAASRVTFPLRLPRRQEGALLVLAFLSGPIAYLLYNPSLSGLVDYGHGAFEMARGYAESMSSVASVLDADLAIAVIGAIVLSALYASARGALSPFAAAMAVAATWVAFRHGYVRADPSHTAVFFGFSLFVFAFLMSQLAVSLQKSIPYVVVFVALIPVALYGIGERWLPWRWEAWSPAHNLPLVSALLHWDSTMQHLDDAAKATASSAVPMQLYGAKLKGAHVLIFPWDLAYAATGSFDLFPLYPLQAYSAYTRYLDQGGAERIRNAKPAIDYVVFEWKAIDGRHPLLDAPATWNALYEGFEPDTTNSRSLLLGRRRHALRLTFTKFKRENFHPGVWVPIPPRQSPVGLSADFTPALWGTLDVGLYKLHPIVLETQSRSGASHSFRVPMDVLSTPFLINCLPSSLRELQDIWQKGRCSDPIVKIRFTGAGLYELHSSGYDFYDVGGTNLQVSDRAEPGSANSRLQAE